ncbi:MAG: alpha/beta hydrolase [Chloroflexi bacterium]|nr:alpha/beta hydrolase [Chloroflexota bacterium]MQC17327.1 alpha/beta hydrolase [Chloroflexota bacterium]
MDSRGRGLVALTLILGAMLVASCANAETDEPQQIAIGAMPVTLTAADGTVLGARIWTRSGSRIVVYLHEFRDDQSSWWPYATAEREADVASLTLDFRGHGESEGDPVDFAGMVTDVEAAIAFVLHEGYREVMLVGAGMGGAVAIVTAATIPDITVAGLSTPAEFGELTPLEHLAASQDLASRVWLLASEGDVSAANSLEMFRDEAGITVTQTRLYAGREHGVAMLTGQAETDPRRMLDILIENFWVEARLP